jgi:hypothetical protein
MHRLRQQSSATAGLRFALQPSIVDIMHLTAAMHFDLPIRLQDRFIVCFVCNNRVSARHVEHCCSEARHRRELWGHVGALNLTFYQLSAVKMSKAMRCRMNSPSTPTANWNANIPSASRSSRMGPNHTSHKLISVKLEDESTCPLSSTSTSSSRSRCSALRLSAIGRRRGL